MASSQTSHIGKFRRSLMVLVFSGLAANQAMSQQATEQATASREGIDIFILPSGRAIVGPAFRVYTAAGYVPSEQNITLLKELALGSSGLRMIAIEKKEESTGRLWCRGSFPVDAPGKLSHEEILEGAANVEIAKAGVVREDVNDKLVGRLEYFDFSSVGTGTWKIKATFNKPERAPVTIDHTHTFELSFLATKSCHNVTAAMMPAIEGFWRAAYKSDEFLALLKEPVLLPKSEATSTATDEERK